jgi:hypothetical protein
MTEARCNNLMVLHVKKLQVSAKAFVQKTNVALGFLENFNMFICVFRAALDINKSTLSININIRILRTNRENPNLVHENQFH